MAAVSDTAEGSGESFLKQWLTENRLSGLQNKLLVEAEMNAEELLDFALNTNEAIQFCEDFKVPGLLKKRFIKALQTFPARYAQQNNGDNNMDNTTPKLIVATLSKEEEEIINKVNTQRKMNKTLNEKIDILLQTVTAKEKLCYNEINNIFTDLEQALNKHKNKLRADLEQICTVKKNKLLSSKQKIEECKNKIKKFQAKNTELLMDWQMDKTDRKQQIIANGNNIMSDPSFPTNAASQSMLDEDVTITLKLDKKAAIKFISEMGTIDGRGVLHPPTIQVTEILWDNITITANYGDTTDNIETLQVELCEYDGKSDDDDDVKLQWMENIFQINNVNESCKIQNIKSDTRYRVRAKVKNEKGWSTYGKVSTFKTEKRTDIRFGTYNSSHYVVSNNGKTLKVHGGNCYPSPAYSSNGYNTGVHVFSVKAIKTSQCCENIGITCGPRKTPSEKNKYHYFYSFGGHSYHFEYPWKKCNDVATVRLDCNNWKVTILDNGKQTLKETNIEKGQTYYFALNGCGAGCGASAAQYEIVE